MKLCALLILLLCTQLTFGQDNATKKPEYVILIDGELSSKERVDDYAKQGYVKSMTKGVSEEEHATLKERYGKQIGGREFIVLISLYTEKEKQEKENSSSSSEISSDKATASEQVLLNVNDAAKDFTVTMLDGSTIRLSDLKGKVILLNFWATWCAPCLLEFYDFPAKIIAPNKNSAFVLLPISRGESQNKVAKKMAALKKDGVDFNVGIDPDETIWSLYAQGGIPQNFLIDKRGIVRYVSTGYGEEGIAKLAQEIQKLLNE